MSTEPASPTDDNPESTAEAEAAESMDMGVQPLDALLDADGLDNHALVAAAAGNGLTHKVVQKARKGRQLTARAQKKVLAALNAARKTKELGPVPITAAFNYVGR